MKKIVVAAAIVASLALAVTFVTMPHSSATRQKNTLRKGPRALSPLRSEVPGVTITNARFENGSTIFMYFDVTNYTDKTIIQSSAVAGNYTISADYDKPLAPGETWKGHIEADNIPDGGEVVLAAVSFSDGTSEGREKEKALLKEYRDKAAQRAAQGNSN